MLYSVLRRTLVPCIDALLYPAEHPDVSQKKEVNLFHSRSSVQMRMQRLPAYKAQDAESIQQAAALTIKRRAAEVTSSPMKRSEFPSISPTEAVILANTVTVAVPAVSPLPVVTAVAAVTVAPVAAAVAVTASSALTALRQSRESSQRRVRRGVVSQSKQMHWSTEGAETPEEVCCRA